MSEAAIVQILLGVLGTGQAVSIALIAKLDRKVKRNCGDRTCSRNVQSIATSVILDESGFSSGIGITRENHAPQINAQPGISPGE